MKRGRLLAALGLAGGLAVAGAVALVVLVGAFSGDSGEADRSAARASQDDSAGSAADPSDLGEGIQVHGDWVIEVRNADGSLAERREFQNQFLASHFMDLVLARTASVGEWGLTLVAQGGPCGPAPFCFISEVGGTHNWGIDP